MTAWGCEKLRHITLYFSHHGQELVLHYNSKNAACNGPSLFVKWRSVWNTMQDDRQRSVLLCKTTGKGLCC